MFIIMKYRYDTRSKCGGGLNLASGRSLGIPALVCLIPRKSSYISSTVTSFTWFLEPRNRFYTYYNFKLITFIKY